MTEHGINFDELRNLTIGTVEFISPREIKVLLELNAPQNTALNTGVPTLFPKINGFVYLPNVPNTLTVPCINVSIPPNISPDAIASIDSDINNPIIIASMTPIRKAQAPSLFPLFFAIFISHFEFLFYI